MVAIHPGEGQPGDGLPGGEAIWRLLTGVAHDSWEAICKHSPHAAHTSEAEVGDAELKPRAGGGGSGGNNNGRGSNNYDNGNDNNNNGGDNGKNGGNGNNKDTTSSTANTTPAKTTTPEKAASTPTTTPTTTSPKSTPAASTPAATSAETTTSPKTTPAIESTPTANNDNDNTSQTTAAGDSGSSNNNNNDDSSGNQASQDSGSGNDVAATGGQVAATGSSNNDDGSNASQPGGGAATDAPAASSTGSNGSNNKNGGNSVYVNTLGQTTTVHEKPTATTAGGALGAVATTGSTAAGSSSSDNNDTTASSGSSGGSHAGVIAGVVVALVALLIIAALLYRFRRSKFLKPVFGRGSNAGGKDITHNGVQRTSSRGSVRSLLTPIDVPPTSNGGAAMAEKTAMGGAGTAAIAAVSQTSGVYNEKQPTLPVVPMMAGGGDHSRMDSPTKYTAANLPPPTYPTAVARSPRSASSSIDTGDTTFAGPGGRARSASRSSYSTFPSTARAATHRHNSSNSVPRLQSVPTPPFANRRGGSNGNIPTGSLPTPPPTAVQPKDASFQGGPQQARAQNVPRIVANNSAPELNDRPAPLALSRPPPGRTLAAPASSGALAPPPMAANARQRQSGSSIGSGNGPQGEGDYKDMDAAAQNRSSYGSVGGSSITSSVLMSPSMLAWPVPPQTPPLSLRDGGGGSGPDDDSQAGSFPSATMALYMVPGGSHRPLTTASSMSSTTLGRGPMPTRAPLNGPSSRNLLQTSAGRRPSLGGPGDPVGYGHISQQQQYQQQPQRGYHQQQYPAQKRAPLGYTQPQASALTVHTDGQATSVRIPISRYQSAPSPHSPNSPDYY
ncbi:hypothetical protein SEUCBS140593_009324 [Sporothrix eucalyptigena]|uniref:Uncharacterized protein n=1 Tax=Sporothrix eucalyptigena TaxID=1812306 RepID=A0ABP0CVG2_9PEZI